MFNKKALKFKQAALKLSDCYLNLKLYVISKFFFCAKHCKCPYLTHMYVIKTFFKNVYYTLRVQTLEIHK